jgi:molybdopterin converting factor small subunit
MGTKQISVHVREPVVLADLLEALFQQYPQLEPFSNHLLVSVNQKYTSQDQIIQLNDEIAIFPPVSGG